MTDSPETPRVRVAWVCGKQTLSRWGRTLQPLAIGLMDEVVEVTALCPGDADTCELPSPPVELLRHGPWRRLGFATDELRHLAEPLRARKIDVVHVLDADLLGSVRRAAREADARLLVDCDSLPAAEHLRHHTPAEAHLVAASAPIQQRLLERHAATSDRIHLVRPGTIQVKHARCFREVGRVVSVLVGATGETSGVLRALEAFAAVHARNDECTYFVLGAGKREREFRRAAETFDIPQEITFVDRSPPSQLPEIFRAADVYVCPEAPDRLAPDCLLAMSAGLPVLGVAGGACDFIRDGETAVTFAPGDAADLTMKLFALLDDRAAARALAEAALGYLREHHTASKMVAELGGLYRALAEAPPSRVEADA